MRQHLTAVLAAGMGLSAVACDATGPEANGRQVGIIEWHATSMTTLAANAAIDESDLDAPVLTAPDTVDVNVPFNVTVTTIGLSGCWAADGARLASSARQATITPYDVAHTHFPGGEPMFCTAALVRLPRTVQVTFTQRGEATLRVEGRVVRNADLVGAEPAALEKVIIVR
jgi:hypothetical protein